MHQHGGKAGHILHAAAFAHVVQNGFLVLAGLHLVGDDVEFVGQRGVRGAQLAGHTHDGLVQRLTGLDADQHHIQRVRETTGDFLFAFLDAAGDPVLGQVISDPARSQGPHGHFVHFDIGVQHVHIDHAKDQPSDPQRKLGKVEDPHRIA